MTAQHFAGWLPCDNDGRGNGVCSVADCVKPTYERHRMCPMHTARVRKYGSIHLPVRDPLKEADTRFWRNVQGGEVAACWPWTGELKDNGYGVFSTRALTGFGRTTFAHRYAYTRLRADIPDGLHLDHVCHSNDATCLGGATCLHRRCVNPWHLEPVTPKINAERVAIYRTHCPQGHPYDEANTYRDARSEHGRQCRACRREAKQKHRQQLAALLAADPLAAPHGTLHGYSGWGCRCQPCRDAYMSWHRDWKARRDA